MRLATKDDLERENEEAERLVRPAPKDKPPRRDRRREQTRPDKDPDLEGESDPDMSKNYKDVGGSAARVLVRWAKAKQKQIPVRLKSTGQPVMVGEKTLRDPKKKDQYEIIKDEAEAEEARAQAMGEKPQDGKKDKGKAEGGGQAEEPDPEQQARAVTEKFVSEGQHKNDAFKGFLSAIPTSHEDASGEPTVMDPETKKRVPFDKLSPDAQKNLIDAYTKKQEDEQAGKAKLDEQKKAAKAMAKLDPEIRTAFETLADPNSEASQKVSELAQQVGDAGHTLDEVHPEKLFPQLKGKLPKNIASVAQISQTVFNARDYDAMSERDKAGIATPKRREPTDEERQASLLVIAETFPPDMATDIIAQDLHPDDVRDLTKGYHAAKAEPVGDLKEYAEKAASLYETNSTRIKPPEVWNGKPFNFLSDDEKATAMSQHQMQVLATSFAAKEKLSEALSMPGLSGKPRVHPAISTGVAQYMLSKPKNPTEASKMAEEMATAAYDTAVREGKGQEFVANDPTAKALLEKLDPGGKKIVQSFLQARDYHAAKDKFLKGQAQAEAKGDKEDESFSERDKPSKIISGLKKALDFFRQSPGNDGSHRSERLFSNRVLDRLRALEPQKHAIVQAQVDKREAKQYEADHKKWKKAHEKWNKARAKHDESQPFGGAGKGSIPFPDPEPVEPTPPARYGYSAKPAKGAPSVFDELSSRRKRGPKAKPPTGAKPKAKPRSKGALRVASRYVSTYPGWLAMDQSFRDGSPGRASKTAIYHGVEPYADDPGTYPDWKPAHQRDLGEADFEQILASAKLWLASPQTKDMEKDAQLRAALDLAVQASDYNRKLHPAVYNMLLARLAGVPEPGPGQTLQTVQGSICDPSGADDTLPGQGPGKPTTETTMTTKLSAEQVKQASTILTNLDNLAETVKAKFASWGMTQEQAKTVVNGLDKVADDFERSTFGEESLKRRQQEVVAAVLQRDSDEPYMDTFKNPHQPIQTDADEPYMGAYGDDQSSAVDTGKEEDGTPLVP